MSFEIKYKGKKLSNEEVFIYAGCILALIAMLLPWVTFGARSANGFKLDMWIFLLPLGFSLYQLKNKQKFAKEKNIILLIELAPAIISAIGTFVFIADKQRVMFNKSKFCIHRMLYLHHCMCSYRLWRLFKFKKNKIINFFYAFVI